MPDPPHSYVQFQRNAALLDHWAEACSTIGRPHCWEHCVECDSVRLNQAGASWMTSWATGSTSLYMYMWSHSGLLWEDVVLTPHTLTHCQSRFCSRLPLLIWIQHLHTRRHHTEERGKKADEPVKLCSEKRVEGSWWGKIYLWFFFFSKCLLRHLKPP